MHAHGCAGHDAGFIAKLAHKGPRHRGIQPARDMRNAWLYIRRIALDTMKQHGPYPNRRAFGHNESMTKQQNQWEAMVSGQCFMQCTPETTSQQGRGFTLEHL